ncbi:MAG: transglycosylase domain-containing protein, partial [Thalassobaculaceae bacterium]
LQGGFSYDQSSFNRATQARRQPGSAFKPLVYLAALAAGYRPDSIISDQPITLDGWRPRNADGRYLGDLSLRDALAQSRNAATVRLATEIGRRPVVDLARRLGLTAPLVDGPSLSLGVSELSPLALTGLYAAFANGGRPVTASAIERLTRADGRVLYRRAADPPPAVVPAAAGADLQAMLAAVVTEGTGRTAALDRRAYGKTGTSQKFRDAWFAGFDDRQVAVVWLGNDNGAAMDGVTGGGLPARVWADVMTGAGR